MWPRVAEVMLGLWLVVSPFVFRGTASIEDFVVRDVAAGTAVVVCSVLSFWRRTEWAHFGSAAVALLLGGTAYLFWERPGPPAAQNEITVGICILLLAILPNEASRPPKGWR